MFSGQGRELLAPASTCSLGAPVEEPVTRGAFCSCQMYSPGWKLVKLYGSPRRHVEKPLFPASISVPTALPHITRGAGKRYEGVGPAFLMKVRRSVPWWTCWSLMQNDDAGHGTAQCELGTYGPGMPAHPTYTFENRPPKDEMPHNVGVLVR